MTSTGRTARFAELFQILQKHFQPILPDPQRSLFELLLFGCCLEDAPHDRAEDSFARLQQDFFDWNEVRVSTVRELAEVFSELPEPNAAANRLKRVLQSIFETTYTFDLEHLRKLSLGQATDHLKKIDGTSPFTVAYVVQAGLGGHVIPLDSSTLEVLRILGLATDEEIAEASVSGLERSVSKSQGSEFASLLHELGAAFKVNPYSPAVRDILLEINPDCAERLPHRLDQRAKAEAAALAAAAEIASAEQQAEPAPSDNQQPGKTPAEVAATGMPAAGGAPAGAATDQSDSLVAPPGPRKRGRKPGRQKAVDAQLSPPATAKGPAKQASTGQALVKGEQAAATPATGAEPVKKRRGRPRKHPLPMAPSGETDPSGSTGKEGDSPGLPSAADRAAGGGSTAGSTDTSSARGTSGKHSKTAPPEGATGEVVQPRKRGRKPSASKSSEQQKPAEGTAAGRSSSSRLTDGHPSSHGSRNLGSEAASSDRSTRSRKLRIRKPR